jgi:hypothetical protein
MLSVDKILEYVYVFCMLCCQHFSVCAGMITRPTRQCRGVRSAGLISNVVFTQSTVATKTNFM